MKRILSTLLLLASLSILFAQTEGIGINTNGNAPDPSAMLDIQSSEKGLLIPRMDSSSRNAINSPSEGLMVYDSSMTSFWFFDGGIWQQMRASQDVDTLWSRDSLSNIFITGGNNQIIGEGSFVAGKFNTLGPFSRDNIVLGNGNFSADGNLSIGGWNNSSDGVESLAFGYFNTLPSPNGIAVGKGNILGIFSGAIGIGRDNLSTGLATTALGSTNKASGVRSTAIGASNETEGALSVGIGFRTKAESFGEIVLGVLNQPSGGDSLNWVATDPLFVIGNGQNANARSNAMTILKNGRTGIGTASPANTLHLVGNQGGTQGVMTIQNTNSTGFAGTYYNDLTGDRKGWIGWVNTTATGLVGEGTLQMGSGQARVFLNPNTGRVGIGTPTPSAKFAVSGGANFSGNVGISGNANVSGGANISGNVGIGINNPTRAKLEIDGSVSFDPGVIGYLNAAGATGSYNPNPFSYSIYASNVISGQEFHAHSDQRIKDIQGVSDAGADLSTLMQIEVTDYRLRDSISKGHRPIKKVIAQQVAEVYPQAVSTDLTEVVPDIYQRAEVEDGWIMLATDLQVGERVKLITETASEVYEVSTVEANRFQVSGLDSRSEAISPLASHIFVYGREVSDFHTVDYEALSMLNVSATQAQQQIIEAQQTEIEVLKAEKAAQQQEMNEMRALFEARLQALELADSLSLSEMRGRR